MVGLLESYQKECIIINCYVCRRLKMNDLQLDYSGWSKMWFKYMVSIQVIQLYYLIYLVFALFISNYTIFYTVINSLTIFTYRHVLHTVPFANY